MPDANIKHKRMRRYTFSVSFKRAFSTVSAVLLALLTIACTMSNTAYQTQKGLKRLGLKEQQRTARAENWVLPANARVYVAYPEAGEYLSGELPRLRSDLSLQLERRLKQSFNKVETAAVDSDSSSAHLAAISARFTVLLVPRIEVYEANISSMDELRTDSGVTSREPAKHGRDRLQLVVGVYDVQSGRMLDSVAIRCKTGLWAFSHRDPSDLAAGAVEALTGRLTPGPVYTWLD